jgi:formylglycine-generating enzyme required for sulfatase activity
VINVSWEDAKQYVEWLSKKVGKSYRLLSEAEWEYAARAGTATAFSFGNNISPNAANYDSKVSYAGSEVASPQNQTMAVGAYPANPFGLHDMHGNVWEWTEDCWNDSYIRAPTDGTPWTRGDCSRRVLRGGSYFSEPRILRSANRVRFGVTERYGNGGFRVARDN